MANNYQTEALTKTFVTPS